ncbi:MAG TPA: hypothetical protein VIN38_13360 [Thiobacillus sp.]
MIRDRHHSPADDFDKTIVNIPTPYRLRNLCPPLTDDPDTKEQNLGNQQFKVRFAQSDMAREAASMLVQKRYAWRGYQAGEISKQPNRITLITYLEDQIVGSLNIGYDSPEGLMADERYREEIDALRAEGAHVGEITKLAIDETLGSKQVLAGMINIAYLYGVIHGVTDAVIEVTPRHRPFYERMLAFKQIGGERFYTTSNTDVVLLHIKMDEIRKRIDEVGGKGSEVKDRSVYPYFFPPGDQEGILERLLRGD